MKDAPQAERLLSDALTALEDPELSGYQRGKLADELRAQLDDEVPVFIECPDWCEISQHDDPGDHHSTLLRDCGEEIYVDMHTPDGGGRTLFTVYLGPAKVEMFAEEASKLTMALVEMLGKSAETFTRRIVLGGDA